MLRFKIRSAHKHAETWKHHHPTTPTQLIHATHAKAPAWMGVSPLQSKDSSILRLVDSDDSCSKHATFREKPFAAATAIAISCVGDFCVCVYGGGVCVFVVRLSIHDVYLAVSMACHQCRGEGDGWDFHGVQARARSSRRGAFEPLALD